MCLKPPFRIDSKGTQPRSETRANNHKLTVIEEVLSKHLLDADKRGFSIQPVSAWNNSTDPTTTIGVNWASTFIKRHPALRTQYNRRITYQRAKQGDPKLIKP